MRLLERYSTARQAETASDQQGRYAAALAWLALHRRRFSMAAQHEELKGKQVDLPWRIKPLGELVLLVRVLERYGIDHHDLSLLSKAAIEYSLEFDWHLLGAFDASAASPLAMLLELFEAHGIEGTLERDYVEQLWQCEYFEGMDRIPYRSMDVMYALGVVGFETPVDQFLHQFTLTSFGKSQQIPRFSFDDMYSLTHAIFYLTDFGFTNIDNVLSGEEIARLRRTLLCLVTVLLRADNRDILGEVLLCWGFCGFVATSYEIPLLRRGMRRITAMCCPSGAVAPTQEAFDDEAREPGQFRKLYHTTLVMTMLFAFWEEI
ncbi:MAG: hypothetical protein ACJAVZ_003553 [Afipia broomeae]|jgi:hypothetical protein|uniref:DUF6895 family protein n=1 Tax=Qipengyuania profunda TaxID=3113984 RepID=UPI002A188BBD|nr:hypothetical protein [Qipengyuania sp. HL-TH1]WPL57896.1 hypothetical protein SD421_05540 [Qipengyuania sp. HL-TH5]